MKVHECKHLRVTVPSTMGEWCGSAFAIAALVSFAQGDKDTAWHFLEMGMLVLIFDKI